MVKNDAYKRANWRVQQLNKHSCTDDLQSVLAKYTSLSSQIMSKKKYLICEIIFAKKSVFNLTLLEVLTLTSDLFHSRWILLELTVNFNFIKVLCYNC